MISLSKIFKTNKLSYILRESKEDDFTVDAPKDWNINDLKIGDTIVPNMWNLERIEQAISQDMISFPNWFAEPHTIESFTHHEDVAFTDGTKRSLYFLKIFLQPQYQINIDPLNESQDEFNIDTPKGWDIGELKVGDKLIPDMFQPNTNLYDWASSFDLTLKKIDFRNNKITYILTYVNGETNTGKWNLDYFEKDLAPGYELKRPSLSESDDEFTVDVPEREGWDETELRAGHYFNMSTNPDFSGVWNNLEDVPKSIRHFIKQVIYIGPNVGQYKSPEYKDHVNIIAYNFPTDKDKKDKLYAISFEEFNKRWNKMMNASVYSYLEESQDEFNVDAPLDWDEYDGNVIITYEIENEGEVYVPVADEEEFERLNPNIKINYGTEPIYVDTTYKSKSVNINELIKELENYSDELLPFTGPKTTENFKTWIGNDDYYLSYAYQFLDPTEIENKYKTDDRKPVRVTKKMKENIYWRYDDDIVDIKILDVQFIDNINESKDEFAVDAPKDWNVIELTVGDEVTPDMWKETPDSPNSILLTSFVKGGTYNDDDLDAIVLKISGRDYESRWELNYINSLLKPEYLIVPPTDLYESDEFTVDAPKDWNKIELTVGSLITPDMYTDEAVERWNYLSNQKMGSKTWGQSVGYFWTKPQTIYKVFPTYDGNYDLELESGLTLLSSDLKDQYSIVSNMFESEDEYNVDAPKEWNFKELGIGDSIVSGMFKNPRSSKRFWMPGVSEMIITEFDPQRQWLVRVMPKGGNIKTDLEPWNIYSVNQELKDQYKIVFPEDLVESTDEFTVDAPQDWSVIELKVGDTITPDIWERDNFIQETVTIADIWYEPETEEDYGGYIVRLNFPHGRIYDLDLDILNDNLKYPYQIFSPLNESDEFSVDVPQGWNIKELGVGDILNNTNMEISDVNFSYKITDFKKNEFGSDLVGIIKYEVDDNGVKQQNKKPSYWYVSMVNKKLKPGYQVVVPEPLKESDDDFNVTPDESWNVTYLQVGDKITYDMLRDGSTDKRWFSKNKDAYIELEDFKNGMYTVSQYNPKDNSFSRYRVVPEWFNNSTLDPQYKLDVPLDNQVNMFGLDESDDDFTVDAPKEWGIEGLTVGDTLDPSNLKMQNFRKKYEILGFIQRPWGNDVRLGVYELVEEPIPGTRRTSKQWKQVKVYYASLKGLEDLLKPGYEIVPNTIVESDDDFTVDAPKEWNLNYEQPINITISYEEEVRDRTGKYGVLLKSYFTQTNLTELEQISGYNFPYDELTPSNVQKFIIDDQDLLIEIEDMAENSNIEVIESYNGFDFDNYQVRGLNNFYVDVELPVA